MIMQPHQELRVLIIPGLCNSEPSHWQSWLQTQYRGAKRVQQADWHHPELEAWADRIGDTITRGRPGTRWIAVAHSFGVLALARHIGRHQHTGQAHRIVSALLVAPADPIKFKVDHALPQGGLGLPTTLIGSEDDPWMPLHRAREWAQRWGSRFQNLGAVGHINTESGFGPWPLARYKVDQMIRDQQRTHRIDRAHPLELNFAV